MSCKLNSYYITGFVDGEGFFIVSVNPYSRHSTGYRVRAIFTIGLHKKDLPLLELIKSFFGIGHITKFGNYVAIYKQLNLVNQINILGFS